VDLERIPLSLVNKTEEQFERKNSGSGLEIREYDSRDPSRSPRGTLYPQKLALTFQTSSGRLLGIVRSQTQTNKFLNNIIVCIALIEHPKKNEEKLQ
jgi:hypothetical protein